MNEDARKSQASQYAGMEIFEIKPVILGGSPTDPENKIALTRQQHIQAVNYWNRVIYDLRNKTE